MRSSLEPFLSGSETQKAKSKRMLTSRGGGRKRILSPEPSLEAGLGWGEADSMD